jgi:predicted alpha/beta-fold hydrolase
MAVVLVAKLLLRLNGDIMRQNYQIGLLFLLLLSNVSLASADSLDREREKLLTDKLAEEAKATETLWLEAGGEKFLALLTDNSNRKVRGAVIILHSMGGHADWPQMISPLRTKLPEYGWTSLSIQLPVIAPENQIEDYGKTLEQATARIKVAVDLLFERKYFNIVAIGHSFGAASLLTYLGKQEKQKIIAMVAIGLQDYAFVKPSMDLLGLIEKSKLPVLDIYGSRDFKKVIDQAADRRLAAKKGNNLQYSQMEVEGADHYFNKLDDMLIKRIRGWLDKAAPGVIMRKKEFEEKREKTVE